jgi:hypothetical protein
MGVPLAIAGGVGTAIQAFGALQSGFATSAADAYKAQVAANNAAIARMKSKMDIQSGEVAAVNRGLQTRAKVGSEKAQQGAAGVDVNTGSAVDLRAGTTELGMLDSLTIRSNAAKKAWSDEVEATSDTAQSQLDTMAGQQAETAGEIGAAGSLLSGASTVGGNYAAWQTKYG